MAKTNTEKTRDRRARMKSEGLVPLELWVRREWIAAIKAFVAGLAAKMKRTDNEP